MKHLKKDDGYVLIYVLIAFTILSFVAVSICTVALNNLKAQKADVVRMEARYAAEGELQKFVAEAELISSGEDLDALEGEFGVEADVAEELNRDATAASPVKATVLDWNVGEEGENAELHVGDNKIDVEVIAWDSKEHPMAEIHATLRIPVEIETDNTQVDGEGNPIQNYTYQAKGPVEYVSYDISYEEVSA